jgi:hypothetical protein
LPCQADERQGLIAGKPAQESHDRQGNQPPDASQDEGSDHQEEEAKKHQECQAERSKKRQVKSDGR